MPPNPPSQSGAEVPDAVTAVHRLLLRKTQYSGAWSEQTSAEVVAATIPAIHAARDQEVRERLEAALGLLPCDCPARGLTDPEQHADECAIGIGGRMIHAALDKALPTTEEDSDA
jgi:hypothetical protein